MSGEICKRRNRVIGGCKFEARYDLGPADLSRFERISGVGAGSFMEKLRSQTYRGDVCIRCGKTVNVPPNATSG